jgi:hypothetical protein
MVLQQRQSLNVIDVQLEIQGSNEYLNTSYFRNEIVINIQQRNHVDTFVRL